MIPQILPITTRPDFPPLIDASIFPDPNGGEYPEVIARLVKAGGRYTVYLNRIKRHDPDDPRTAADQAEPAKRGPLNARTDDEARQLFTLIALRFRSMAEAGELKNILPCPR